MWPSLCNVLWTFACFSFSLEGNYIGGGAGIKALSTAACHWTNLQYLR